MGIRSATIHFEEELPDGEELKNEFYKITGLKLYNTIHIETNEISNNKIDIAKSIIKGAESNEDDYSHSFFYLSNFYEIEYSITSNSIQILYGINQKYFPDALIKSLLNLGGKIEGFENSEFLKKMDYLKKWNDYNVFNRSKK